MFMDQIDAPQPRRASFRQWINTGETRYIILICSLILLWFVMAEAFVMTMQSVEHMPLERAERFFTSTTNRLVLTFGFMSVVFLPVMFLRYWTESKSITETTSERVSFVVSKVAAFTKRIAIKVPIALASFVMLLVSYMSLKTLIPEFVPFYLDPIAAEADRVIFFGHDAWEVFGFVYDMPSLLKAIDISYTAWAMIVATVWISCFALKFETPERRFQFCLATILLWFFGGNLIATFLSTAGPCYYESFFNDGTFQPMMEKLSAAHAASPLNAVAYHDTLLSYYENPSYRMGGISAMPSLHNGTAFLFMCLFWRFPVGKILTSIFMLMTFVGSIVLAWHYAIDAFIAIPVAYLAWWVSGKCITRIQKS